VRAADFSYNRAMSSQEQEKEGGAGALRPTRVEVDLERLAENYRAIAAAVAPARVMPVVKANAYGHGLVEVGRLMVGLGAACLGVAIVEEALALRAAGVGGPILVLGGISAGQIPLALASDIALTVYSLESLALVEQAARQAGKVAAIHLKIDTGMERLGVHYYEATPLLQATMVADFCRVEGIFSHFANSDAADLSSARLQLGRFQEVLSYYERRGLATPARHMANSGAILQLPASHLDMVRPGIMLYGVYPSAEVRRTIQVRPALSWKSSVVYVKVVQPEHPVSYGWTWQSDHPVRLVTIPAGYGDGYFRALSNKGMVLIGGRRYPIAGRVCMDQLMVNMESDGADVGDEVVLLGEQGDEAISAEELARLAGTIGYEILTNINSRVPRTYRRGQG
jgi:alanine racemase